MSNRREHLGHAYFFPLLLIRIEERSTGFRSGGGSEVDDELLLLPGFSGASFELAPCSAGEEVGDDDDLPKAFSLVASPNLLSDELEP